MKQNYESGFKPSGTVTSHRTAKSRLLLMMLLLFAFIGGTRAQEELTLYDGTATNSNVPFYGLYADTQGCASEFVIPVEQLTELVGCQITGLKFYLSSPAAAAWTGTHQVYLGDIKETTLTGISGPSAGTIVFEGSLDATGTELTIEFSSPYTYYGGNLLIGSYVSVAGNWKSAAFYGEAQEDNTGWYRNSSSADGSGVKFLPKTTFMYIPNGPYCSKPSNLILNYAGGTTAEVNWMGEADSYNIDVNGTVTEGITTNSYTLTELELGTTYEVKVQAVCSSELQSYWTNVLSFTTDLCMPEEMCNITFTLTDSYGDGWNGNAIKVVDALTGAEIATLTNEDLDGGNGEETQTINLPVCNGREIQFQWVKGGYPTETSWVITDINEEVICEGAGAASMSTGDVLASYFVDCTVTPWRAPSDLAASEIGPRSAKLSWTENSNPPATAWVVAIKAEGENGFSEINADANPYTIEDLTPETTYTFKVRPVTDDGAIKWSEAIDFTTDVAFPAPTDVTASDITATTATISWTSDAAATGAEIQYTEGIFGGNWYYYDNGTFDGSVGTNGGQFYWGIMLPAGSYTGNLLKVSIYDYMAMTGTITIYNDGDDAPAGSAIGSKDITLTGAEDFAEFSFDGLAIDATKNLWVIVFNGSGATYPAAYCTAATDANGRWISTNGTDWIDITSAVSDAGNFMIRAEIGTDVDPSTLTWTTVADATSPQELTGLTPDTEYTVRVKAVYGTEGESKWTTTSFKTLEDVPTPTGLAASNISNKTVELSWTENGEATTWQICLNDDEANLIAADSNPFTIENLIPETEYTAKVRAINGEKQSNWSAAITFTTDIAFPAPTEVAASDITSNSATINWTGYADSYNVRYKVLTSISTDFDDSTLGDWTTIDADGDGYTWVLGSAVGGIYLAAGGSLAGTGHNSSADMAVSGSYSNVVGALTPDNYLVSPKVKLGGSITFYAGAQDASYAGEHFGVAVSTTGNTSAADFTTIAEWTMDANGGAKDQGLWGKFTVDLSDYAGQEGYVAIRHFNCTDMFVLNIDDIVIELPSEVEDPWTVANNITDTSYEITGLTPETNYDVQVQAVYTTDEGESEWVATSLKTLVANPVPYNIVADLVADGATITWEGEGDSYKVQYRTAANTEVFFYDDFQNGLGNWKTYTEGEGDGWIFDDQTGTATSYSWYDDGSLMGVAINADNWLVSPKVDLKGTLQFYAATSTNYPDSYEVLLSTTGNTVADFTDASAITLKAMAEAENNYVSIDLSDYAGQQGYIAIHHVSADCMALAIYDFGIFGNHTDAGEMVELTVTEPTVTISGLATNNGYEYQILSVKGEEESDWSEAGEFALLTLADDGTDNSSLLLNNIGRQAHVTLANRTLFKDGNWNTITLPFYVTDLNEGTLAGATVKTLTDATMEPSTEVEGNSTVTLTFGDYDFIYAGYPFVIKWEQSGSDIVNPEFANVTIATGTTASLMPNDYVEFVGNFDAFPITAADADIYYMISDNQLTRTGKDRTLKACRGYFRFTEVAATARQFVLDFGEGDTVVTGINDLQTAQDANSWYTVNGMKLNGKPARKGLYIQNGQKVVIK